MLAADAGVIAAWSSLASVVIGGGGVLALVRTLIRRIEHITSDRIAVRELISSLASIRQTQEAYGRDLADAAQRIARIEGMLDAISHRPDRPTRDR